MNAPFRSFAILSASRDSNKNLIDVYRPLMTEVGADYVAIQVASVNPDRTLEIIEKEVLPELRGMATV